MWLTSSKKGDLTIPVRATPCATRKGAVEGFVSNAVSNAEKSEASRANFSERRLLRFCEIWTIESDGEL